VGTVTTSSICASPSIDMPAVLLSLGESTLQLVAMELSQRASNQLSACQPKTKS
jgi:hypothetical protein